MHSILLLLFAGAAQATTKPEPVITLSSGPARVLVERLPDRQDLNFELFIDNASDQALTLSGVQVSAYDAGGLLLQRRLVDGNGTRPSVNTLPDRTLPAHGKLTVFNPFASFGKDLPLARLDYQLTFDSADGESEFVRTLQVKPQAYTGRTALKLPLRGKLINYDGHDFLAHHRRFDYTFAPMAQMGFRSNFMRYSYDFVPVDENGSTHTGDGSRNQDYPGFGATLTAVGAGTVLAIENARPDDRHFDPREIATNPMCLFGNYLVIDHGNGEFSVYGHLKQGSVRVKPGQRIAQGEVVAQVGASGSAMFPHLHYELQDGGDTRAEGLPSYFRDFRVWLGATSVKRALGTVDTGEIIESD